MVTVPTIYLSNRDANAVKEYNKLILYDKIIGGQGRRGVEKWDKAPISGKQTGLNDMI